jgi:hypothetical protein
MSARTAAILFMGVLIGASLSVGAIIYYKPSFFLDILLEDFETSYEELLTRHQNITKLYEIQKSELLDLQDKYDRLEQDFKETEDLYASIVVELEDLRGVHKDLIDDYEELYEQYDILMLQYELVSGSSLLLPEPVSNETIRRDFVWNYDGQVWTLSLHIPEYLYEYYTNKTRVPSEEYSVYVTHPYDDEYISTIVSEFVEIKAQEGYDEIYTINLITGFVQSLPYASDNVTTSFDEYPRYPVETLVDGGGDCEDTSILTAALLEAYGYDVVLVSLPEHMAIGVNVDASGVYYLHEDVKYFYLETTGEGWGLGALPEEFQSELAYLYPLNPIPICVLNWSASISGERLIVAVTVENVGTAKARGIKIFAGFEVGYGMILNPRESDFFDLDVEAVSSLELLLSVPLDEHMRLVVRVLDPWGLMLDESYSGWFNS